MSKQMSDMNCSRGAPMGRRHSPHISTPCRLFQVRLDTGGYDDGGAYWGWGRGERLWCARDDEGNEQFVRAPNRSVAAHKLRLNPDDLKNSRGVSRLIQVTFRNGDTESSKVMPFHETARFKASPWLTLLSEVPLELGQEF